MTTYLSVSPSPPHPTPHVEHTTVVNYCVFTDSSRWDEVTSSDLESYLSRFIADVLEARGYVFGFGFGVAMVVAFLYIGLLQIPFLVSFLVWSCVLLILVALVVLAIGLWVTAGDWDEEGTKDDVSSVYMTHVQVCVFSFLFACSAWFVREMDGMDYVRLGYLVPFVFFINPPAEMVLILSSAFTQRVRFAKGYVGGRVGRGGGGHGTSTFFLFLVFSACFVRID